MRRLIFILGVVVVLLLLGVGGCRKAGTWLVRDDAPEHADVIVLLMGNLSDRVLQVSDLYTEGKATKVWIVESYKDDYKALEDRGVQVFTDIDRALRALGGLGIPADSIQILPGNASSTQMEAESVRNNLQSTTGVDTLVLVSSSTHTRRAYNIFNAAFKGLEEPPVLLSSPSAYTEFHAEKWWKDREDIQDVVLEYLKMVNFFLFEKRKLRKEEL